MLYPVELQSRFFPEREGKCRGNFEGNKPHMTSVIAQANVRVYFRGR